PRAGRGPEGRDEAASRLRALIRQGPAPSGAGPRGGLLRHRDRADEAGITRRRVLAAVVREGARRVEGELKGSARGSAAVAATSGRRGQVGATPNAGVADGGMRRWSVVGPDDGRPGFDRQSGRREREIADRYPGTRR